MDVPFSTTRHVFMVDDRDVYAPDFTFIPKDTYIMTFVYPYLDTI